MPVRAAGFSDRAVRVGGFFLAPRFPQLAYQFSKSIISPPERRGFLAFPITSFSDHQMTRLPDQPISGGTPPPRVIPSWRRLERPSSQSIPDWRAFELSGLDWRRVSFAPPPPTPYVHPIPPKVTQSTQESAEGRNPMSAIVGDLVALCLHPSARPPPHGPRL
jgi:hypothetical protein